MQFFYWNKSFEIGIAELDQQHKNLVDLINKLASIITEGGKLPDVQSLLSQLLNYAAVHFRDEEQVMGTCSLSNEEKDRHLKEHHNFVEKAREVTLRSDLMLGEVSQQLLEFLTTWLISHILGSDKKIAEALTEDKKDSERRKQELFEISPVERLLLGALTETERRFRLISDHTPVLIWVSDATGERGFFNRAWSDFVGINEESTDGVNWAEYIHINDRAEYLATIDSLMSDLQPGEVEYRLRHYTGNYHWFLERILPRIDANGVFLGHIASSTDISGIKQAEELLSQSNRDLEQEVARRTEQLEQLMLTDPLTGVGNRRMLTKRLEEEVLRAHRYQRPLTIAFFDIDHFKSINDTYGHSVGDVALACVAESLKLELRDCDILGRLGGEEFVVLLPETDIDKAMIVAERMRTSIEHVEISGLKRSITVSAGLAELVDEETGEDLLDRSDKALYLAKKSGRNCCIANNLNSAIPVK